jgi:hypothetical protein
VREDPIDVDRLITPVYDRPDLLAHDLVWHCQHRGLENARCAGPGALDLDDGNVLAAPDDDVLGLVDDVHPARRVDARHVTGVQPPVDDRLGSRLWPLPVAAGHIGAADHQLAECRVVILRRDRQVHRRYRVPYRVGVLDGVVTCRVLA